MFKCQHCQRQTQPGEKAYALVVQTRVHPHPFRTYFLRGERTERRDPGGVGTQIVRQLRVCHVCHEVGPELARSAR